MAYNVVTRHSDQETPANSPTSTSQPCSVVINTRRSDGGYDYPPETPPFLSLSPSDTTNTLYEHI